MSPLFSRAKKQNLEALLLIDTGSASLILFEKLTSSTVKVIHSEQRLFPKNISSAERQELPLITSVVHKLLSDLEVVMRKTGKELSTLERIIFYYTAPFSILVTQILKSSGDGKETLNESILKTLIAKTEENVKKEYSGFSKFLIIERSLSKTVIDGYPVREILFRPYKEFSALLRISAVSERIAGRLNDICHSVFKKTKIEHRSCTSSVLSVLAEDNLLPEHFLCSIIYENTSEIFYVDAEGQTYENSFNQGTKHLETLISKSLSSSKTIARSYAMLYKEKKLHGESELKFLNAIKTTASSWLSDVKKIQRDTSNLFITPKEIHVVTSSELSSLVFELTDYVKDDTMEELKPVPIKRSRIKEVEIPKNLFLGSLLLLLIKDAVTKHPSPCQPI